MTQTQLFLAEIDRESERSRRALECVPPGQAKWKPHDKSMEFFPLASMVATIFTWVPMIINMDELDVAPKTPRPTPEPLQTSAEYLSLIHI